MLRIDKVEQIEGITIYGDDRNDHTFYLVPNQPRFRLDDEGKPIFRFLKYRSPVPREDGLAGGYCFFDVAFVVPDDRLERVRATLQRRLDEGGGRAREVQLGTITYTDGTSGLLLQESAGGALVEAIEDAGKPSLYGQNISAFSVEFTPEGATLFEQALQGKGGVLQVAYDLNFWAKLPPVTGRVFFRANEFERLVESFTSETERRGFFRRMGRWFRGGVMSDVRSAREEVSEVLRRREVAGVEFDFADAAMSDQQQNEIRAWGWETLADAVKRMAFPPPGEEGPEDDGDESSGRSARRVEVPGNANDFERRITSRRLASFDQHYTEQQAVVWNIAPQGTMPNITTLGVDPAEYFKEVDLDDPFFRSVAVPVQVNAPFEDLSIHSIATHFHYPPSGARESYLFTSPDERKTFAFFVEGEDKRYRYRYEVNFRDQGRAYEADERESEDQVRVINVDDTGVFAVDVGSGNVDFERVMSVEVAVRYEDTGAGVAPISEEVRLEAASDVQRIRRPIFTARDTPYRYRIRYFLRDGRTLELDWRETNVREIFVNDPFGATALVSVRAVGDLEDEIQNIFLDLTYVDEANGLRSEHSRALNASNPFFDWSFPVVDADAGILTYSGTIQYRDGRTRTIEQTQASERTIVVGDRIEDRLQVEVFSDLLPLDELRLARVSLTYRDEENGVTDTRSVVFRPGDDGRSKTVSFDLRDASRREYSWKGLYVLSNGGRVESAAVRTSDDAIFPELPS